LDSQLIQIWDTPAFQPSTSWLTAGMASLSAYPTWAGRSIHPGFIGSLGEGSTVHWDSIFLPKLQLSDPIGGCYEQSNK
jgi:hypothetical protein